jgi:hypothetical protein
MMEQLFFFSSSEKSEHHEVSPLLTSTATMPGQSEINKLAAPSSAPVQLATRKISVLLPIPRPKWMRNRTQVLVPCTVRSSSFLLDDCNRSDAATG